MSDSSEQEGQFAVEIVLRDWEYLWAVHVGLGRDAANAKKSDAHYYDQKRMENNKRASIASACAEIAVARVTRRYWSGSVWTAERHKDFADLPDVEPNIEVRRTRKPDGMLAIRAGDVEQDRTMFLAHPQPESEFQTVTIIGWCKAVDVWDMTQPAPYDQTGKSRLLAQSYLSTKPPADGWGR